MRDLGSLFPVLLLILFFVSVTSGAMPLAPNYCEHMGYNYTYVENGSQSEGMCRFNENKSCEAGSFLEGECGQQFVEDISCREKEETVFTEFESCCGDLEPHTSPRTSGQSVCRPEKSSVQKLSGLLDFLRDLLLDFLK